MQRKYLPIETFKMATGCINSKKISCFVPRSKPIKTKVPNNIFGALCKKSVKTIVFLRILHQHQSHYREAKSRSGRGRFRWKVFKIWANIGLVSNTKNIWANYEKGNFWILRIWLMGRCQNVQNHPTSRLSKSIFYIKNYPNLSQFFFHWRISI